MSDQIQNDPPAAAPAPVHQESPSAVPAASPAANSASGDATPAATTESSGSRGGGQAGRGGRGGDKRKQKNQGRKEYNRNKHENRRENKRVKTEDAPEDAAEGETGEKEDRKPKRKAAVLISYCGTGYKGMQWNPPFKSIEGDLFEAFGKAGAVSAANSVDPKKSSFVRCARTDKGVHAAGNVISLKLIIEPGVVDRINEYLPEQIRVLDIVRTTGSFSAYQAVDSRIYEYLIPSHAFLPPHPKTHLAKTCRDVAEQEGDLEGYLARQQDADGWWEEVDKKTRSLIQDFDKSAIDKVIEDENEDHHDPDSKYQRERSRSRSRSKSPPADGDGATEIKAEEEEDIKMEDVGTKAEDADAQKEETGAKEGAGEPQEAAPRPKVSEDPKTLLLKRIRAIHNEEKRGYRVPAARLARIRETFQQYVGTKNYHNYTDKMNFKDPSAKRHIKSFNVVDPVIINGTEWLSCRVHGQSFMIHQIRKMVGMAMMVVRTGCPVERVNDAMGPTRVSIPKAPSLGLLLERPVFDHYNTKLAKDAGHQPIDFDKHQDKVNEFRQKHIYTKIFDEEYHSNVFTQFYQFLDTFQQNTYRYLTSAGLKALEKEPKAAGNKKEKEITPKAEGDATKSEPAADGDGALKTEDEASKGKAPADSIEALKTEGNRMQMEPAVGGESEALPPATSTQS